MKTSILYLLLFAYTTIMIRPVMPYAADAMAHLLWYHQHVATVHTENGKQHVHLEVEKENKKTTTENTPENSKKNPSSPEHTLQLCPLNFCACSIKQIYSTPIGQRTLPANSSNDFPPPRS